MAPLVPFSMDSMTAASLFPPLGYAKSGFENVEVHHRDHFSRNHPVKRRAVFESASRNRADDDLAPFDFRHPQVPEVLG